MKKTLASLIMALACSGAWAATTFNTLIINRADGVEERMALASSFAIYADGRNITLQHSKVTLEYAMEEVKNFTFGNHTFAEGESYEGDHIKVSAIDEVEAPGREIILGDSEISSSTGLIVYNLKGIEVARGTRVDLTSLPAGIYVVKAGTTTMKITL